jgi:hypothetical protein
MAFFGLTTNKKRKEEKNKNKQLRSEVERLRNVEGPDYNALRSQARTHANEMRQTESLGREEGKKRGEEFLSRNFQGLTPQQRQEYESQANRKINREVEKNQRELIGKQGRSGLRGGSAYAQKADLARLGHEARQDAQSSIRNLDTDLSLKKMASQFAIEEGGAAQRLLNEQLALDELRLDEERKRQRRYEQQFNRNFSRI